MADLLVTRRTAGAPKAKQGLEGSPGLIATVGPEDNLIEVDLKLPTADSVVSPHKPVLKLAAAPKSCLGSAHPRLVKLDLAPEMLPSRVHHRSTKLVEDHPRGFIAAEAKLTLQQ